MTPETTECRATSASDWRSPKANKGLTFSEDGGEEQASSEVAEEN